MSLPKYIVNFDELAKLLDKGINIQIDGNTNELEELAKQYLDKILELLQQLLKLNYMQCSIGLHSYIPALQFDYELTHVFEEDILITGITYSQTGWKIMDCWSLYVNDKLLFDELFTKELGEHKVFNAFYPVKAGEVIKIVHHNNSGNSKQVWYDIDYFVGVPYMPPVPVEPPLPEPDVPIPDIPEIKHEYNWIIVMRWESNTNTDIDLVLKTNSGATINFISKELILDEHNKAWLDYDFTSHLESDSREKQPEIITILGKPFNIGTIYVRNFIYTNGKGDIQEDITVDIYKLDENKSSNLIKHFSISPDKISQNDELIEVCQIDLVNEIIKEELQ